MLYGRTLRARLVTARTTPVRPAVMPLRSLLEKAVMRSGSGIGASSHYGAQDEGCRLESISTSTESQSVYRQAPLAIYEGNNKQAWLDIKSGFCHLCQEPVGGSLGIHIGDRDHMSLQFFLFLHARYPRVHWARYMRGQGAELLFDGRPAAHNPRGDHGAAYATTAAGAVRGTSPALWKSGAVLEEAESVCPSLRRYATHSSSQDHLHVVDDAMRRAELEALILTLSRPPHLCLSHTVRGEAPLGFWYSGERMWKPEITRLIAQIYPPMSAGTMTSFSHKCWGRSNGERMYDALQFQKLKGYYGWGPFETKEKKCFFFRLVLWELLFAELREDIPEVTKHMAAMARRRIAFEMVFLQSMDYMNQVQRVYEELGRPSVEDLFRLNVL